MFNTVLADKFAQTRQNKESGSSKPASPVKRSRKLPEAEYNSLLSQAREYAQSVLTAEEKAAANVDALTCAVMIPAVIISLVKLGWQKAEESMPGITWSTMNGNQNDVRIEISLNPNRHLRTIITQVKIIPFYQKLCFLAGSRQKEEEGKNVYD